MTDAERIATLEMAVLDLLDRLAAAEKMIAALSREQARRRSQ